MTRELKRQVWIGRLNRRMQSLFDSEFASDVLEALDPSKQIESYNRRWRLSKPELRGEYIHGKLGFERLSSTEEVSYDESVFDFVVEIGPSQQGNFSQFVISIRTQRIAFEQKGSIIKRQSFHHAFNKILRDTGFELDFLPDEESFENWLEEVDRVTKFSAKLSRRTQVHAREQ